MEKRLTLAVNNEIEPPSLDEQALDPFYKLYFDYTGYNGDIEVPTIYNRWCPIAAIGALLSRQCWFEHGHWTLYPNMYIMLIGEPATRKTTAIDLSRKILRRTGYDRFSADRTSKERFLIDLRPSTDEDLSSQDIDDLIEMKIDDPSDRFVVADEFTDFVGKHNLEFLTMLSRLWDNLDSYKHPKINGASIVVDKPTVSILSGSQPEMLYSAFPPEAIGQGIMSRFIMVYAQPTGIKVDFPDPPSAKAIAALTERLNQIKQQVLGPVKLSATAKIILGEMYKNAVGVDDFRFKHYNNRRFTHLLKLSMIFAAMDCRTIIGVEDAVRANTLLHVTESRMPRALGEFGKSKNSDVANKILGILTHYNQPVSANRLFKELANEVDNKPQLIDILFNMQQAEKIKSLTLNGKQGFVPNYGVQKEWKEGLLDKSFLTAEEFL